MKTTVSNRTQLILIIAFFMIFLCGLTIRLFDLNDAPLDFHPTRQLHSALMARGIYFSLNPKIDIESWKIQKAIEQWKMEGLIEPPILEWLAAFGYRLSGVVNLEIPRLIVIFFWMIAGILIFLIVKRITSFAVALFAVSFFFFYPYGIIASRSFQPETLLVMGIAAFLLALVNWSLKKDWKCAIIVGLIGGLTILIKTVAVFLIGGMWLGWLFSKADWKKRLADKNLWIAFVMTFLPYTLYLFYGLFINKGYSEQFSLRFFPSMWTEISFYLRWFSNLRRAISIEWLLIGISGVFLWADKEIRFVLIGGWIGYILLGFLLPHHISTHDYYHLPLFIFVSIGSALFLQKIITIFQNENKWFQIFGIVMLIILFGAYLIDARSMLRNTNYIEEVEFWQKLGLEFGNEAKIVALSEDYGNRLAYWGWITPKNWPRVDDVELRQAAGQELQIEDYFEDYINGYDYFLITDFEEFEKQPRLFNWLEDNFIDIQKTDQYYIYNLTPSY